MKKVVLLATILLALSACATSPVGTPEILDTLLEDQQRLAEDKRVEISTGRPLFIKVQSYPQLLKGGDIRLGGDILILVGREQLDYLDLVKKHDLQNGTKITPKRLGE